MFQLSLPTFSVKSTAKLGQCFTLTPAAPPTFRFFQLRKYSPNSRCRPPSYVLAVFGMFLAIISPSSSCSSYSWNEWDVRHFFYNQNISTSSPGLLGKGGFTCSGLHFWRHFLVKHKILPNLVISNWLWWIMHVLLANQNWGIFCMNNKVIYNL